MSGLSVKLNYLSKLYRPFFPLVPLFQSESKYETILMKMTLICMRMKLHAELSFALRLVLKQRHKRTRKWPIRFDGTLSTMFEPGLRFPVTRQ